MNKRGSTIIEAALIVPLIFLIVATVISAAFTLHDRTEENARENRATAASAPARVESLLCDLLRGRWLLQ